MNSKDIIIGLLMVILLIMVFWDPLIKIFSKKNKPDTMFDDVSFEDLNIACQVKLSEEDAKKVVLQAIHDFETHHPKSVLVVQKYFGE